MRDPQGGVVPPIPAPRLTSPLPPPLPPHGPSFPSRLPPGSPSTPPPPGPPSSREIRLERGETDDGRRGVREQGEEGGYPAYSVRQMARVNLGVAAILFLCQVRMEGEYVQRQKFVPFPMNFRMNDVTNIFFFS